jgi:5-methylthioadenosine/S-adenosylhomocysteine deaminase
MQAAGIMGGAMHSKEAPMAHRFVPLTLLACGMAAWALSPAAASEDVWLVDGGLVIAMDKAGTVIPGGSVAIRGNKIEAVGPAAELASRFPGARRLDASGRIVMPGLINAHTHVPMTLFRGVADDLDLKGFLYGRIFPAEARFVDEEFVRWGTRLACLELLQGGVTTFVDMYYFEDAIAEEAVRCGMRAVVGETLVDFPAPDNKTWADALAYTEKFVTRWRGHRLVTPAVAPHATYTVSADHLREAHALAAKHDVPMLMHLAEARSEVELIREKHGKGPVEYAAGLGILDDRVVAAHMIFPSPAEIALLAEHKVGVAHCPQSNMKGASGVAPVPALLAAGVAVGLGTDGAASNNDLSLWEEMDTAAKLAKVTSGDPTVLNARTALAMATLLGAQAIGLQRQIGSLEPGKRADLILVRTDTLHQIPNYDPYSLLVYSTKASDVDTVIIDGELVMVAGRVLTVNEATVRERVAAYQERIAASTREPRR